MLSFVMAMVLLSGQQTPTPSTTPPAVPAAVTPAPPNRRQEEGVVCRSEAVIGSNRRQRVCTTAAEREAKRLQSERWREGQGPRGARERPTGGD